MEISDWKPVKSGRKAKTCNVCEKDINVGESSITVTVFDGEYGHVSVCNETCLTELKRKADESHD